MLEDWRQEHGHGADRTYVMLAVIADASDAASAADAIDFDFDAADAAAADEAITHWPLLEEPDMCEGLKLLQVPGRYGYAVTIVGRLRRVAGDEYVIEPGARTVVRTSGARTLAELAADGPGRDHRLLPPTKVEEEIHRLTVRRALVASEEAWGKEVERG